MKKILCLFLFLFTITASAQVTPLTTQAWSKINLITSAQTLTSGWVNLGSEIKVDKANILTLWFKVDINSSQNFRWRILLKHTASGDSFQRLIQSPTATVTTVTPEYFELTPDADTNIVEAFNVKGVYSAQIQVQAGTVGSPAGQILDAKYSLLFE